MFYLPNYQDVGFAVATGKLTGEDTVLVVEMLGSTSLAGSTVAQNNTPPKAEVAANTPANSMAKAPQSQAITTPVVNSSSINLLGSSVIKPLINSKSFTSISSGVILSLFIFVLCLDMIIIERKKIIRFVGHNLDHIIFLTAIFGIVIILMKGSII